MINKMLVLKGVGGTFVAIPTTIALGKNAKIFFSTQSHSPKTVVDKAQKITTDSKAQPPKKLDIPVSENNSASPNAEKPISQLGFLTTFEYSKTDKKKTSNMDENWMVLKNNEDYFHHQGFFYRKWADRLIKKDRHKHKDITHITLLGDGIWSLPASSNDESKIMIEKGGEKWEIPMKTIKGSMNRNDYQTQSDGSAGDGQESSFVADQKAWKGKNWAKIKSIGEQKKIGYVHPRTIGGSCDPVILSIIEYDKDAVAPESEATSKDDAKKSWTPPTNVIVSYKGVGAAGNPRCSKTNVLLKSDSKVKSIEQITHLNPENGLAVSTQKHSLKMVPGVRGHDYESSGSLEWWGKENDSEKDDSMKTTTLEVDCKVLTMADGDQNKSWITKNTTKCPDSVLVWGTLQNENDESVAEKVSGSTGKKVGITKPFIFQIENFRAYCKDAQSASSSSECTKQTSWNWSSYWYFVKSATNEIDLSNAADSIEKINARFTTNSWSKKHSFDWNVCLQIPPGMKLFAKENNSWVDKTGTDSQSNETVKLPKVKCGSWKETMIGPGANASAVSSAFDGVFKNLSSFTGRTISETNSWQYTKIIVPTLTNSDKKMSIKASRYSKSSGANSGVSSPNWGEIIMKVNGIWVDPLPTGSVGVHFVD